MRQPLAMDTARRRLIEGNAGPFYVAMNRATFYLCASIFIITAPIVVYLMRSAPLGWRISVEAGTAIEMGTLLHILVDRVYGWRPLPAWGLHGATAAILFGIMWLTLH